MIRASMTIAGRDPADGTAALWEKHEMVKTTALIAFILAFVSTDASAKDTRFWNLTANTITSLQLSPAGKNDWGRNQADNDRDGIPDVDDKCPNIPENKNGIQDEDGCPEGGKNDRDGDGIPDDVDKCPDDPEDFDGFQDADGCPDPDNDQDGILDVDDLCPNDPEDKDGFEDADGCPDPDNDKDRILDKDDKCPNEPETYNGYQDADGCPDKGKVIVHKGKLEILDKIYFETDKDEIKSVSFPLLDAIAATLNGNPQIEQIEIQGHADERGDDAHNLDLTERRAHSVRVALEQRNVLPGRMKSHGYGETKPICTQHNEDCWSQNRRVEFIILKRSDEAHLQGGEGQ